MRRPALAPRERIATRQTDDPPGPAFGNVTRGVSAPLLIEARAVLDPGDLGVTFFRRLLEAEAVSLRPSPFASEGPLIAFNHHNRRERSRLATGTGSFLHQESARKEPQPNHVLVGQPQGDWVERILTERPQFFGKRPSVGLNESHARIASQRQQ